MSDYDYFTGRPESPAPYELTQPSSPSVLKDIEQTSYTAPDAVSDELVNAAILIADKIERDFKNKMKGCFSQSAKRWQSAYDGALAALSSAPSPEAVRCEALEEAAKALDAWGDIYGDNAALSVRALQTTQPEPAFAASIAEVVKEESLGGAACGWKSCTGCLETSDGYHCGTYPYSDTFKTHVGSGCSECGGLGVVWEHYSKEALEDMQCEPEPAVKVDEWQPIETAPRDGTLVDLWSNYGTRTANVRWVVENRDGARHPSLILDGWKTSSEDPYTILTESQFTHWMPLPAAPLNRIGGAE